MMSLLSQSLHGMIGSLIIVYLSSNKNFYISGQYFKYGNNYSISCLPELEKDIRSLVSLLMLVPFIQDARWWIRPDNLNLYT